SLDVSFDALVTDLCPIDLLFQRIGRMHRHDAVRPEVLREARVVVTGYRSRPDGPPAVPGGSRAVYGEHLLWRTAAVLRGREGLELPPDIPELVDRVYGDAAVGPESWQEALAAAAAETEEERQQMRLKARAVALKDPHAAESLADLQEGAPLSGDDDENSPRVQALVRLGPPSLEVILLRAGATDATARTVSQGIEAVVPLDRLPEAPQVEVVLDQAIRLPGSSKALTEAAQDAVVTPEAWKGSPWLASARVLLLPADGSPLRLADVTLTYDPRDGLTVT
ncbi:CRISPR-associated helicase/endonuclease Cas3, partial [Streptomyces sp. NPDC057654]